MISTATSGGNQNTGDSTATDAGPRLRRDAAANRQRLITTAIEVFNDEGIEAGVEHIAQRAGLGIGTLYRHFPTKQALIEYLIHEILADMAGAAEAARNAPGGQGLERYARAVANTMAAHRGCLARLWERAPAPEQEKMRHTVADLLRDAQTAGVIRDDVTLTDVLMTLRSVRGVVEAPGDDPAQACQRHLDFIFAGMRPASVQR
ncbi:TetR/AcrR family transcriptional regulator [Frankia sp. Mgl5]|uniref:TetR/AcrR family transcriptional regulator n=1 Tax=Frankia sp. Mgl5 TaxID=2933793 RepID=UPI002010945E|nr:TetR/AcrR family transcriptional regulator [Frankia sp. Mgl5]MCK9931964.1 TetR/AcrR family transcriptional regulator [Frankia sp. Mgl5]